MATANHMDTGQAATSLLVVLLPLLLHYLASTLLHLSPVNRQSLAKLLWSLLRPGLRGRLCLPPGPRKHGPCNRHLQTVDRKGIMRSRIDNKAQGMHTWCWRTYLFSSLWRAYQVGCCIKANLWFIVKWLRAIRHPGRLLFSGRHLALQENQSRRTLAFARFDTDSFAICVDNHASRCMGNDRRWFENLIVARAAQHIGGISKGFAIKGKGTLVFNINDDTGKPHRIKIPNSLFLPGLKMCLLLPQHWAQEAGDNYPLPHGTRMENNAHSCVLRGGQGKFLKTIPFDPATNTPIFRTSLSTSSYCAFMNTFIACEAPFFRREHVLQLPGHHWLAGIAPPPEEFVAKENLNYDKSEKRASEGVILANNETVPTANLPPPPELAPHPDILHRNALTYDLSPVLNEDNKYSVSAPDNQAELMCWHYRLGHTLFTSLHQLACNGEIPTKLANV
jgi:hypothetical protein